VEIGAEATVDERERWAEALAHLYADLGRELKTVWANGSGLKPQDASESHGEAIAAPEPTQTPEHFCQEHQTPFKQYHRGENVWWSHKRPDGKWCREK